MANPKDPRRGAPPGTAQQDAHTGLVFRISQMDRSKKVASVRFDVTSHLPNYKRSKYLSIERSYPEFEKLRQHLIQTYSECVIPALPPPSAATATTLNSSHLPNGGGAGIIHINPPGYTGPTASFNTTPYEEEAIVREAFHLFLARIAEHPILRSDYELREFIEAPFLFNPATMASGSSRSQGSFLSFGTSRRNRNTFPQAADQSVDLNGLELGSAEWYDSLGTRMAKLETQLQPTKKIAGRVSRRRKALSECLQDFAAKNVAISVTEPNDELSLDIQRLQADHESMRLEYFLDIQAQAADTLLDCLVRRQQIYAEAEAFTKRTERKKQNIMVLRSSSSIHSERADQALEDYEQAKTEQAAQMHIVERVNTHLPQDLQRAERLREHDYTQWLKNFAKRQLEFEKKQLDEWQQLALSLSKPKLQQEILLANGMSKPIPN
ncbi:Vacuolar protein sorting-associated protein 17 [Dimargaris cristalligena]|nr:Vacuolar protein sorting-associated protein 17 [Dimargaris cristalligena]